MKWLRKIHGWVGLWGAALGLLFGITGFLLNHRAGPLKISTGAPSVLIVQVQLPQPAPASPDELAEWVKQALKLKGLPRKVSSEPAHEVVWGSQTVMQPERWQVTIARPGENAHVEYWRGNQHVTVKRSENTFLATLVNLHRGTGLSVGWVLLTDTLAGSLALLTITGVLIWMGQRMRRWVGGALLMTAIVIAMLCIVY